LRDEKVRRKGKHFQKDTGTIISPTFKGLPTLSFPHFRHFLDALPIFLPRSEMGIVRFTIELRQVFLAIKVFQAKNISFLFKMTIHIN
jgi:hypothetical protein